MTRIARQAPGGVVFHVLNRGVGRMGLFEAAGDYLAFEQVLAETLAARPMRLLAYCVMPNHWHLVLWPQEQGQMAGFMQRLTITHVRRWVEYRRDRGNGHVYQGRYKSFPVQDDAHFLAVARYVERNALRAGLVARAEDWRFGSLWHREHSAAPEQPGITLAPWPVERPRGWLKRVNQAETPAELEAMHQCVRRGSPYGGPAWVAQTAARLGLEATLRGRGRPRRVPAPIVERTG